MGNMTSLPVRRNEDQQNATSDLYPGSLSHIETEQGPIYLHYLGL